MKMCFGGLLALWLWMLAALPAPAQEPCHGEVACQLGERSYHVKLPDDWDGITPMPVLLHFHGWNRQGDLIVKHMRISGATRKRGVLLVAPNGLGRSWDFWGEGSPDSDFARKVLEDVARRWPVDTSKIFVSGYSWGASMAWRFVCEDGADIAALLAVSGVLDQNESCATGPREVRHVHGLRDTVLDFPYGPKGEQDYPVWLWRQKYRCGEGKGAGDWQATPADVFERSVWNNCKEGRRVLLDVHKRGHFIPKGWIAQQLDELLDLTG